MPHTLCAPPADMRHNQVVDLDQLREDAAKAVSDSGLTLEEVGALVGKHKTTVHRALNDREGRYPDVVRDIIAAVTDYEVPETPMYRYVRKGK